uniref:G017_VD_Conantokin_precursor_conopeptide n=1 Tax=Conus geographus TaxID=6491 RepID=X5IXX8_CONGE|nr:G017_VD_Conantokin_precursor_conopeptide [Conus geographus]
MHLYTYLYLLVPLVTFHLILGTGTLDDGGALTERRSADATALKAEPVLLQKSAARSTDDNGKDRLTQMKRILQTARKQSQRRRRTSRESGIDQKKK